MFFAGQEEDAGFEESGDEEGDEGSKKLYTLDDVINKAIESYEKGRADEQTALKARMINLEKQIVEQASEITRLTEGLPMLIRDHMASMYTQFQPRPPMQTQPVLSTKQVTGRKSKNPRVCFQVCPARPDSCFAGRNTDGILT